MGLRPWWSASPCRVSLLPSTSKSGCQYSNVPGATLRGVDLISGADRFETTIPFFPVTGIAYYAQEGFDGLIITVRQTCTRRFCREVEPIAEQCVANDPSNAALVQLCLQQPEMYLLYM